VLVTTHIAYVPDPKALVPNVFNDLRYGAARLINHHHFLLVFFDIQYNFWYTFS